MGAVDVAVIGGEDVALEIGQNRSRERLQQGGEASVAIGFLRGVGKDQMKTERFEGRGPSFGRGASFGCGPSFGCGAGPGGGEVVLGPAVHAKAFGVAVRPGDGEYHIGAV